MRNQVTYAVNGGVSLFVRSVVWVELVSAALCLLVLTMPVSAIAAEQQDRNVPADVDLSTWNKLRAENFGDRPIMGGKNVVGLDVPYHAEDPAVVPITIMDQLAGDPGRRIKKLWLIIDNNPEPMSAEFTFGPAAASATIATRVRVNAYTFMRVIAETGDGKLYMTKHYVKAAGGCSAPVGSDPSKALKHMGEMRLRHLADDGTPESANPRVQLLIRHPNITGLQMDQLTRLVWPAHYVDSITIHKGDVLVLDSHMTFSLSENPSLRFDPKRDVAGGINVRVHDNKDNIFTQSWSAKSAQKVANNGAN